MSKILTGQQTKGSASYLRSQDVSNGKGKRTRLGSMRYKGFVWPHNPRVYTISFDRSMAVHKVPFGRYKLQGLGMTQRVMRGEGEFVGENAYQQFKALAAVFYENTPGPLLHPLWDTSSAWFVHLELAQEPRADYVKYRFEFWEDYSGYQTGIEKTAAPVAEQPAAAEQPEAVPNNGNDWWILNWGNTSTVTYTPTATVSQPIYHTVTKGQTLWGISQRYGVSLNDLIALNPQIKNPNLIYVGDVVRVS